MKCLGSRSFPHLKELGVEQESPRLETKRLFCSHTELTEASFGSSIPKLSTKPCALGQPGWQLLVSSKSGTVLASLLWGTTDHTPPLSSSCLLRGVRSTSILSHHQLVRSLTHLNTFSALTAEQPLTCSCSSLLRLLLDYGCCPGFCSWALSFLSLHTFLSTLGLISPA